MEGASGIKLTQSIAPQETVTISVPLRAPWADGTYTGYWSLQGDDEVVFLSNNSVRIIASSSAFKVISVTTDLIDRSPSAFPYNYSYSVQITTSSAGTVSFHTIDSEGDTGSIKKIKFDSGGTKEKDLLMVIPGVSDYWVKIYIDVPNNQSFGPFKFDINP